MKFVVSMAFNAIPDLLEMVKTADDYGWDMAGFSDHVVHHETLETPYPYTDTGERRWEAEAPWPDPWVIIGACAAVTKNIRFTTNVFVLPLRNPYLAAKAIGTAAIVSDNRITLTLGVGWCKEEYEMMQQDFHTRGKRCDEMIDMLRKLWAGGWVEHEGQHYQFDRLQMNPPLTEQPPIWVGGISKAAHKRAARNDGWLTDLQTSDEIISDINNIQQYRKEYGRDHLPFDVMASASDAWDIGGYQRLEEHGVTHVLTMPWAFYHGEDVTLEQKKDGIKRFAEDVVQKMK